MLFALGFVLLFLSKDSCPQKLIFLNFTFSFLLIEFGARPCVSAWTRVRTQTGLEETASHSRVYVFIHVAGHILTASLQLASLPEAVQFSPTHFLWF